MSVSIYEQSYTLCRSNEPSAQSNALGVNATHIKRPERATALTESNTLVCKQAFALTGRIFSDIHLTQGVATLCPGLIGVSLSGYNLVCPL